jgi:UDP-3-O-acyl-N-acetylglucosamine deacetylase
MENLLNQENLEDIREFIENKISDVPGELILCGAVGTLLLSAYLNKTGHKLSASMIGKLAIPIIGIGLAKYKDFLKSEMENLRTSGQES